ncbi:hypothetical protein [Corallococcus sp. CA053C]|uniref:hypothetical protein n=1 Tax=Corallococcus sp. CA053C TaxID=2316732 RepID=UPI0011C3829D|nr:hypothetical protein [Corallococcus sp. CA053C]
MPDFVTALRRERRAGYCLFCPRPLSTTRAVTCGRKECIRAYNTTWRAEERRRLRGEQSLYARESEDEELAGEFRADVGELLRRTSLLIAEWCARVDELVADLGIRPRRDAMSRRTGDGLHLLHGAGDDGEHHQPARAPPEEA